MALMKLPVQGLTEYGRTLAAAQGILLKPKEAVPDAISKPLQELFKRYYPEATYANDGPDGLRFEFQTGTFKFPRPAKGQGQKYSATLQGPLKGGIFCEVNLEPGKYVGALAISPSGVGSLDRKHFKVLAMAPYSMKRDDHLWARLSYPPDVDPEFVEELRKVVMGFADEPTAPASGNSKEGGRVESVNDD